MIVILANLVVVLVFCFYKLDSTDEWQWENVGYRTGFIAIAQLPLIFLLAGRQNLIGLLVDMGYERLNWYHRWISRTLWLTATIHMGFWFRDWDRYDYIVYQLKNDTFSKSGFAAWCILTFIVIASFAPVRRFSYEIFVLQHLVTFVGFIVAVWFHAPDEVKVWVWISIGFLVFDRAARWAWTTYVNLSVFHLLASSSSRGNRKHHPIWANRASFTPLPGNVTRITIENPVIRWEPGQHVFFSCHSIVPFQSHPFTIASLPGDGKMEFLVRAQKGATRRIFRYASKHHNVLYSGETNNVPGKRERAVLIDGPYGTIRPLRQFDSVVLLAGGMGATFTMPILRDIVAGWKEKCLNGWKPTSRFPFSLSSAQAVVTKRLRFVWVIKSRAHLSWFEAQLRSVLADIEECRNASTEFEFDKALEMSIYITCDEKLDETRLQAQPGPCQTQSQTQTQAVLDTLPGLALTTDTIDEKKIPASDNISTHSLSITSTQQTPTALGSSNDSLTSRGGCCCTTQIKDEDAITPTAKKCNCSGPSPPSIPATETETEKPPEPTVMKSQPHIPTFSGRPHPKTIIRKVLEQAEGESAVVVCGPRGLTDDVRRSVVSLSDERAVHKGTGAQGIYLHVENFGW